MSQRDGYEHGVPSWIAGAHPQPARAAAFYTELFGWQADPRGDHLVCTLRGRDVAGFVQGDDAAWRTNVWVESADDAAERATAAGGSVVTAPFDRPGVGRTAVARRPRGRRVHRLRARPPPRRPGRQRAGRVGDERALDARSRECEGLLRRRLRLGDRHVRRRRHRGHAVAPPRLRGRRALAAGAGRRRRRRARPATRPAGTSTCGSTIPTPPPPRRPSSAAACSCRPPTRRWGGEPCSPTRRAGPSPSAAWCPHEHDRGRQPRHARRRHAGAGPPRRGPPRRLRARRLGRRPTRTRCRASTWARGWAAAAARCCSAAGPTRRCRTPGRSSRRTTRSGRCSSAARSTSSRAQPRPLEWENSELLQGDAVETVARPQGPHGRQPRDPRQRAS